MGTVENKKQGGNRLLMGVGNPLKGDDGIGPYIADSLNHPDWVAINCGTVPGSYTSVVKRHSPELLVIVDAAKMGLQPGEYRILPTDSVDKMITSTHNIPLSVTLEYISSYVESLILFIGVEPKNLDYTPEISKELKDGAEEILNCLAEGAFSDIKRI